MNNRSVLEVRNLIKNFGEKRIINDISFNVDEGEIVGLLGPNGAGKTTIMKLIVGLLLPSGGEIKICGFDVQNEVEDALKYVGAIVENPDMYRELSGKTNLIMASSMYGNVTKEMIDNIIKFVGLQNRINEKLKHYSLGMKQRLGLAAAIVHKPKLIILDEPTNGLDPIGIRDLRRILKKIAHEDGSAVIVSSHMMTEMELLCDRVIMIDNGKIVNNEIVKNIKNKVDCGKYSFFVNDRLKAENIIKTMINLETEKSEENDSLIINVKRENISNIIKILAENDIRVYEVRLEHANLEDKFMDIMGGAEIE